MTLSPLIEDHEPTFAELFADAVPIKKTLRTLKPAPKRRMAVRQSPMPETKVHYIATDDLETLDAPVRYLKQGCDKNLLRKLCKGAYTVGDQIDLHGCDRFEAQVTLSQFFAQTRANCVLVIHGRGLTLRDRPILRTVSRAWLKQQAFVLAYCEAPSSLGGEGAVLVLKLHTN